MLNLMSRYPCPKKGRDSEANPRGFGSQGTSSSRYNRRVIKLNIQRDELGALVSLEMGKIRTEGVGEVQEFIDIVCRI